MVCKVPLVTKPARLQVPLSLGYQSEAAFTSRQNFRTSMSVCVTDRIAANKMSVMKLATVDGHVMCQYCTCAVLSYFCTDHSLPLL